MTRLHLYLFLALLLLPMLFFFALAAWDRIDPLHDSDCVQDCVAPQDLPWLVPLSLPTSAAELNALLFTHQPGHRRQRQAIAHARRVLFLDRFFPFVYPLSLTALITWAAPPHRRKPFLLAALLLSAATITFDLLENAGLDRLLNAAERGQPLHSGSLPLHARLKWGLFSSLLSLLAFAAMNRSAASSGGADSFRACFGFAGALLGFAGALLNYRGLFSLASLAFGGLLIQGLFEPLGLTRHKGNSNL